MAFREEEEKSSGCSDDELFLNDEAGWRKEAEAVIRDVGDCVKNFEISEVLKVSARFGIEDLDQIMVGYGIFSEFEYVKRKIYMRYINQHTE
jgi:hypothetical protein